MFSKVLSNKILLILFLLPLFLLSSCTEVENRGDVLVSVFTYDLREADIIADLGEENYANENLKQQYIDSWIKKQLLLAKASKSRADLDEINELVKNYRESLLIQKYKDSYVKKKLDMAVSKKEIEEAYKTISTEYRLQEDVFKAELVIVPIEHSDKLDIINYFKKKNYDEWKNSVGNNIDFQTQDTSKWLNWAKISQHIPYDLLDEEDLKENEPYFRQSEHQLFFLRTFDYIDKKEIAPLSYMKPKLEAAIIERKKAKLLEEYNAELYKSALKNNNIKQ